VRRRQWAVLALIPGLLSGCGALGLSGAGGSGSGSGAAAQATGPSWIVVSQGSATPSVRPSYPAASPTATATGGFLPLGPATPTRTPVSNCSPKTYNFADIAAAEAAPSATSAVVRWYNTGGYNLVEFRVTAISQDLKVGKQRDIGFVTVKPSPPCTWMTTTVSGLDRRTGYVFTVDAVVLRRSGDGTHAATVARTHVIDTT
jgi:hypothetical protein